MPKSPVSVPPADAPPFSRPVTVEELMRRPDDPYEIVADPEECAALAAFDGIPAVHALKASFKVARHGKFLRVTGEVRARVAQTCVVTLEDFDSELTEPVDVRFVESAPRMPEPRREAEGRVSRRRSETQRADLQHAEAIRAQEASARDARAQEARASRGKAPPPPPAAEEEGEEDPPDPIIDGRIDLGALAAEFLALGLDPYPRKPGAAFDLGEAEPERESPFAALARLRGEKDG
jgi:hypothetical protein